MQRAILHLTILLFLGLSTAARAEHYSGVSSVAGLPFPDHELPDVRISNAMVHLRQLDTLAEYRLVLEYKNEGAEYQALQTITPLRLFFHEFRPDLRSPLLDRLATLFPAEFEVSNSYTDIRQELKNNFGQRLFVRKFVTTMDLAKLGLLCSAEVGDTPLNAKKIFLEFRWVEPERSEWQGTGAVLCMEVRVQHEVLIKPRDSRVVDMRIKMPSLITGKLNAQRYAPFELSGATAWAGPLDKLFLVSDLNTAIPVLPAGMGFRQFQEGTAHQVVLIENLQARTGDRVAFFDRREGQPNCEASVSQLIFPLSVQNISASSWLDRVQTFPGLQVSERPGLLVAEELPEYEHLSGFDLTMLAKSKPAGTRPNPATQRMKSIDCSSPQGPALEVQSYTHPVFAFDQGPEQGFHLRTAWCEGASGPGNGEHLRFELTQHARAMHVHNGYQFSDEKYAANSRLRTFTLSAEDGSFSQIMPMTDLRILNLYDLELKPGFYKLAIQGTYNGANPTTCLSSIGFDFIYNDPWFREHFSRQRKVR